MKDFFKDKDTRPFAITIVVLLAIFIACCVWFVLRGEPATAKPHYYALATVVIDTDATEDAVICEDSTGNVWAFYGVEDWQVGDNANLLMHDNGTKSIYDDVICGATYANWILAKSL